MTYYLRFVEILDSLIQVSAHSIINNVYFLFRKSDRAQLIGEEEDFVDRFRSPKQSTPSYGSVSLKLGKNK